MLSADAVFSDMFTLNTVGVMTQELKSLFLAQRSNQSVCLSYNNAISNKICCLNNFPKFTKFEHEEKEVDLTVIFVKGIQEMFQCFNNNSLCLQPLLVELSDNCKLIN